MPSFAGHNSDSSSFANDTLTTDPSDLGRCIEDYSLDSNNTRTTSRISSMPSHTSASLATVPIIDEGIEPMDPGDSLEEHFLRRQLEAELEYGRTLREANREGNATSEANDSGSTSFGMDGDEPAAAAGISHSHARACQSRTKNVALGLVLRSLVVVLVLSQAIPSNPLEEPATRAAEVTDLIQNLVGKPVTPNSSSLADVLDQALFWVIDRDELQLSPKQNQTRPIQRFVLMAMWGRRIGFLNLPTNVDEYSLGYGTLECNEHGEWYSLTFRDFGYQEPLPSEVQLLTTLRVLNVSGNILYGTVPTTVGKLTNLQLLSLADNTFSGAIPSELGQLTNLVRLHLSGNRFNETIPTELRELPLLEEAFFHNNPGLSGKMPLCDAKSSNLLDSKSVRLVSDCNHVDCPCCSYCCHNKSSSKVSSFWDVCED